MSTRKAGRFVLKMAVWAIVALLTGELLCRITGLGSWVVYRRGLYRTAANARLSTEFTPGFDGTSYGTPVRINRAGFRGDEISPTPSNGTFRIVCVGDSCTFGMGVPAADAWPAALAKRISAPVGFSQIEIINAGVPGYNLKQELECVNTKVIPLAPHLIVAGLISNDLEPAFSVRDGYLYVPRKVHALAIPGKRWFQTHSYFYQFMSMKYARAVARAIGDSRMATPRDPALLQQMQTAKHDDTASMKALSESLRAKGIPLVVANIDIPANSPLASIGQEAGASVCSIPLDAKETIPDGHPDKRGHARIASAIADVLSGKTPLIGEPLPESMRCGRQ